MESSAEAVIISGPRRGEIIRLPDEAIDEVSDDDIQALNAAVDELITAIDRVAVEVRATVDALHE
jgi:outer membrane murein-binding lipoprotein Lpp